MRAAFRFSKFGATRWISHLDLMRTIARAIRRSGLNAKYTQGFHPLIGMSFAQALGLGYLSEGEYMEVALDDSAAPEEAMKALNAALPEGIRVTGAWRIREAFPTLMASVSAARWLVEFVEPADSAMLLRFKALFERETIEVVKQGRNGPLDVDIRPGIYSVESSGNGIVLLLAAGSRLNIRPELAVKAALGDTERVRTIVRLELYTAVNERHVPLYRIFNDGDSI